MRLFYGWVIVGAGMAVTCIGMGTMMSLGVFLQPMAQDMGWSRAGISFAAVLNFLAMGVGSFFWGSLSDRFGTRAVVLTGGVLLGVGVLAASQAATLLQFQLLFGIRRTLPVRRRTSGSADMTSPWRRCSAHRSSPRSHLRISRAARPTRARSFTWSAT